jgi:hypothetical protein
MIFLGKIIDQTHQALEIATSGGAKPTGVYSEETVDYI